MNNLEQLYNEFEKEVFLYMENELPKSKMNYWTVKLEEYPSLNKYIEDIEFVENKYKKLAKYELTNDKFNSFVNIAIERKGVKDKIRLLFKNMFSPSNELSFGRIAFASLLIIAAVIISVISNRPNPVVNFADSINNEILKWDADIVDDQINKVENLIKVTQDDEYRKYYKYKLRPNNVDKNIEIISSDIESLKNELNNKKL